MKLRKNDITIKHQADGAFRLSLGNQHLYMTREELLLITNMLVIASALLQGVSLSDVDYSNLGISVDI